MNYETLKPQKTPEQSSLLERIQNLGSTVVEAAQDFYHENKRRAAAIVATSATALGGGMALEAAPAGASKDSARIPSTSTRSKILPPKHINGLYTSLNPESIITELQNEIEPGQQPSQEQMHSVGQQMLYSIPSQSVDLKQEVTGINTSEGVVTANFSCPAPRKKVPYAQIESVGVLQNNKADLTFCPSTEQINITHVNLNRPVFRKAFDRFENDPLRNKEWGGGNYKYSMTDCPFDWKGISPLLKMHYSRKNGVRVSFEELSPRINYCDRVGQLTMKATAELKDSPSSKRYKQVGNSLLHIEGLNEILMYYYTPGVNTTKYVMTHNILPNSKVECRGEEREAEVRVKLVEQFKGMLNQEFSPAYITNHVRNYTTTSYSSPQKVCR